MPNCLEHPPDDEPTVDDGGFAISIDEDLLEAAVAAVDRRLTEGGERPEGLDGPLNLDDLLLVEDELSMEIDDPANDDFDVDDVVGVAPVEMAAVRIRAIEAESERDSLKTRMLDLNRAKVDIEAKLDRLNDRASRARASSKNAMDAQAAAETRAKRLKDALEKQQTDINKLLERRKKDTKVQYSKGRSDAVLVLVESLDSLYRALGHAREDPIKIIDGVGLAVQQFEGNLKRLGVERIPVLPGSEFDPNLHEAITRVVGTDVPAGHIIEVVAQGFTLDGRLIRAAQVSVATDEDE